MNITPQSIPEVLLIEPVRRGDHRGWFSEIYHRSALAEAGFDREFVQDNHAFSAAKGTTRALHLQIPPMAQDKLVGPIRGVILDVAVDIRHGSPTFGQYVAVELDAEKRAQLLVPRGFAHGYQSLTENAEVLYKVSNYYAPETERGVLWNDPAIGAPWVFGADQAIVHPRDGAWPTLAEAEVYFRYGEPL